VKSAWPSITGQDIQKRSNIGSSCTKFTYIIFRHISEWIMGHTWYIKSRELRHRRRTNAWNMAQCHDSPWVACGRSHCTRHKCLSPSRPAGSLQCLNICPWSTLVQKNMPIPSKHRAYHSDWLSQRQEGRICSWGCCRLKIKKLTRSTTFFQLSLIFVMGDQISCHVARICNC
jgi:hypothetical protein